MRWSIAAFLVAAMACSSDPSTGVDAGDVEPDAGPVDLAAATWQHTNVFNGPGTTVSSLDLDATSGGQLVISWSEAVESNPIRTTIMVAFSNANGGYDSETVFDDLTTSFSSSTVFAGSSTHVSAGAVVPVTNSDVFYARHDGSSWTAPVNVTGPNDASGFTDFDPHVLEVDGEVVIIFRSRVFSTVTIENDGLYMLRFTNPSTAGVPIPILDRTNFDCGGFRAAVDRGGAIHIVAYCREDDGLSELFYLNNTSGSFSRQDVGLGGATTPLSPDIALSDDGSVHLLWNASTDCGGLTCRDVFYSRDLAPPVSVTGGEEDGGFFPHLAVDPEDRVIVVFHRLGAVDDVLWSYAEVGSSFVRTQVATPGTGDTTDSSVGNLIIHPETGLPHMVYSRSITGAGSDVYHGQLVP